MKHIKLYARNIVNGNDVKDFLKETSKNITVPEIQKWINSNLKTYIQEYLETVNKVTRYNESDPQWLKDSVENGTALEVEFKEEFRDKLSLILQYFESEEAELDKLSKLNFDAAFSKAMLWSRKVEKENKKKLAEIPEDLEGIEVVRRYNDGYFWVRLSTQKALNREGNIMNHCTKDEKQGYLDGIKAGTLEIFSLRDEKNIPHCTMEIQKKKIVKQIKGYSNGSIREKYVEKVKNFIKKPIENRKYKEIGDLKNIGYIEQDGKWHNIYNLQPGFTVKGDLDLSDTTIEKLPINLTVNGLLNLNFTELITELPKNLEVEELNLYGSNVETLPDNFKVKVLDLSNSLIKELPKNLEVEELNLYGSKVETLPDNFKVKVLALKGSLITELPKNLEVEELYLGISRVETLPDNFKVKVLKVGNSLIKELPKNLEVEELYLGKSKISTLPDDIKVDTLYTSSDMKSYPKGVKKVKK